MVKLKYIADALTFSRFCIAVCLSLLGWLVGPESLFIAVSLMLYSWGSDILDGSLARRSRASNNTWIGSHDLYFDMSAAVGLLIYLTAVEFIPPYFTIVYLFLWSVIFWRYRILSYLGKLFQTPVYAWFLLVAFQNEPIMALLIVCFIITAIIITWPRFPQKTVPEFLAGFKDDKQNPDDDFLRGRNIFSDHLE